MFICVQKIIFIPTVFLEILQRYYKIVILDISGMLGCTHQKQQHQIVGNSAVYLQTINQLGPSIFLEMLHFKESCHVTGQEQFWQ